MDSMRYVDSSRLKLLMGMFYVTGSVGIFMGLSSSPQFTVLVTFMGVVNIGLGALFTFVFLAQKDKAPDKRKKKKKKKD